MGDSGATVGCLKSALKIELSNFRLKTLESVLNSTPLLRELVLSGKNIPDK